MLVKSESTNAAVYGSGCGDSQSGSARHAADDREALTALLANMATVENVFDDACRDLTRPAIAARLEAATGRAPSPREVEILFDIFDASHNDKISLREARSALHRGDAHPLIT